MESFDITALYTVVSNESAMQTIYELLTENERTTCIWSGNYSAQIRGLATGQRLAATLAIAFMSTVESPIRFPAVTLLKIVIFFNATVSKTTQAFNIVCEDVLKVFKVDASIASVCFGSIVASAGPHAPLVTPTGSKDGATWFGVNLRYSLNLPKLY
ncbi:hypothetical protein KIN20_010350 [Parelaphostrongylus tenuis]|uniref:Reverse transcriptase domain-containing protein n=1 Tax=Parelaphostrongylus tenuis TaxID=148309 RepID=A0AAD5QIS2_PARTN|nr:hypothetical protein KIN20_010350 [Parelaphostrongylus tenuis]